MAYYVKVNRKVYDFLALPNRPLQLPDGNFLIWQADMLAFGPIWKLMETCAAIGAVALTPQQAAAEQRGISVTPLPVATDPRFIIDESEEDAAETPEADAGDEPAAETGTDTDITATDDGTVIEEGGES